MRLTRAIQNAFKTLGVSPDATIVEIRSAYRELAKKMHPDLNPSQVTSDAKFKAISAAYDELKDEKRRSLLRMEIMGDEDNEVWRDKRESHANMNDVSSDFDKAEAKAGKRASQASMRGLYTFEALVHPRVLFMAVPLLCLAVYTVKSALLGIVSDPSASVVGAEEMVDAWFNPKTNRYETPAPWDDDFHKVVTEKVVRTRVHVSHPP